MLPADLIYLFQQRKNHFLLFVQLYTAFLLWINNVFNSPCYLHQTGCQCLYLLQASVFTQPAVHCRQHVCILSKITDLAASIIQITDNDPVQLCFQIRRGDWFRELETLRPGSSAKGARKWRKLASLRQCGHLFATLISRTQELLRSLHEPPHPLSFRG